jgi:hypothetical protein
MNQRIPDPIGRAARSHAVPDRFLVQIAMFEVDEAKGSASWGDRVTDEESNG